MNKIEELAKKSTGKAEEISTKTKEIDKGGTGVGFKEKMKN